MSKQFLTSQDLYGDFTNPRSKEVCLLMHAVRSRRWLVVLMSPQIFLGRYAWHAARHESEFKPLVAGFIGISSRTFWGCLHAIFGRNVLATFVSRGLGLCGFEQESEAL